MLLDLASEVLLNSALIRDISRPDDPEERGEKIDNALIKSAEHLHEKIQAISRSEIEQREALRAAEAEKLSSKQEVENAYARIHELERALEEREATEAGLAEQLSEAERRRQNADHEAVERAKADKEARKRLEERISATEQQLLEHRNAATARKKTLGWVGAGLLWSVAPVGVALLLTLGLVTGAWLVVGVLLGGLLLVCLGIWLTAGWRRAWQVFVVVGVVIGVVAGLLQVVESLL